MNLAMATQQRAGSIRGVVHDADFGSPLGEAHVTLLETGARVETSDQGNYVFDRVVPGRYTLVFGKDGYVRQVKTDVVVTSGQLTEVSVSLPAEITELDEYVVKDVLALPGTSEVALLDLRFDSPALLDSIGAELMSRAGASDAASALKLVAGASIAEDGKTAVVRGLPDRYVSSQMNGVRLPSADEDKRAVELDQFPAPVIESIQVSKTFTPDQQGDASGGAVDVRLRGVPEGVGWDVKAQVSYNTQVTGRDDFLTYQGGGVDFLGIDDREPQAENTDWSGAVGVSRDDAPIDYKFSVSGGGRHDVDDEVVIGGFVSLFYERDSSYFDDGINDSYWVDEPGGPMVPETTQGTPSEGTFKTKLFDIEQGQESVQWGGLTTLGLESENHALSLTFLYTHTTEDTATLAEDTRGKEYFFPNYDPDDPVGPGNTPDTLRAAPYLRLETLEYTERTTSTLQLKGRHSFDVGRVEVGSFEFKDPQLDWSFALSSADLDQPDKRQFGALWLPASFNPGVPPFLPPFTTDPTWFGFYPAENFNLGNLQRIFKTIEEDSTQYSLNLTLPFEQWSEREGYVKLGLFDDRVDRKFDQDTYSNFGDADAHFVGDFDDFWSEHFPFEVGEHPISASEADVDYDGEQEIFAYYAMMDLPISSTTNLIGGARVESTDISVVNDPEPFALWFPDGATSPQTLDPGEGDVDFSQEDLLPALALVTRPLDELALRFSYSQTVARQTFKELTPILQQEYLGAPVFIGNPDLQMSDLTNYDVRADWSPYQGGLLSASWFYKDIKDPIEYVQKVGTFTYTTAVNYPEGTLSGFEVELRQDVGRLWDGFAGLRVGANATFIDSEVRLTQDEIDGFNDPSISAPMTTRDMTNAPEHLYNFYFTYDVPNTGTQLGLFYTIQGDTLVAGAAENLGQFVPSVYAKEYGTLNLTLSHVIGADVKLIFQAKNLTNPKIEEVYRSEYIDGDVTHTSYTKGVEYSLGISLSF